MCIYSRKEITEYMHIDDNFQLDRYIALRSNEKGAAVHF
jgi:hypothetical protein